MSRDITSVVNTALSASQIEPFFAIDFDLVDASYNPDPLYVWSGIGELTIGSKTYIGAGNILSLEPIEETSEIEAKGTSVTLSGIPSEYIALAQTYPYQGRECRIYFGVVGNPDQYVEVFSGELDQMNIEEGSETATITVTAENVMVKLEYPVVRRFSHEDQKSRFPNDKGLEYVASLQDKEILFGRVAK